MEMLLAMSPETRAPPFALLEQASQLAVLERLPPQARKELLVMAVMVDGSEASVALAEAFDASRGFLVSPPPKAGRRAGQGDSEAGAGAAAAEGDSRGKPPEKKRGTTVGGFLASLTAHRGPKAAAPAAPGTGGELPGGGGGGAAGEGGSFTAEDAAAAMASGVAAALAAKAALGAHDHEARHHPSAPAAGPPPSLRSLLADGREEWEKPTGAHIRCGARASF